MSCHAVPWNRQRNVPGRGRSSAPARAARLKSRSTPPQTERSCHRAGYIRGRGSAGWRVGTGSAARGGVTVLRTAHAARPDPPHSSPQPSRQVLHSLVELVELVEFRIARRPRRRQGKPPWVTNPADRPAPPLRVGVLVVAGHAAPAGSTHRPPTPSARAPVLGPVRKPARGDDDLGGRRPGRADERVAVLSWVWRRGRRRVRCPAGPRRPRSRCRPW
jgi:hypothetical protein